MPAYLKAFYFVIGLCAFGSFSWGVKNHFKSDAVPSGMLALSAVSLLAFGAYAWAFWYFQVSMAAALVGAVFHIAAGTLFMAAVSQTRRQRLSLAYDTDKPKFLITSGPYRFVRHPFYLSYIIFWLGCTIATQSVAVFGFTAAISILYIIAARREEAKFAGSAMSNAYQLYRESTGLLWPKIGKL